MSETIAGKSYPRLRGSQRQVVTVEDALNVYTDRLPLEIGFDTSEGEYDAVYIAVEDLRALLQRGSLA